MACEGAALVGLWFEGQAHFAQGLRPETLSRLPQAPVLEETRRWLDIYFIGRIPDFTPPLRLRGTPFRKAVWRILLEIPYGHTVTYGAIAARLAGPRAVGGAVGSNPVSLIVPCHRVVGADGSLTGYAAGLDRKRALLRLERIPLR